MITSINYNCLSTGIGSVPLLDAKFSCELINKYFLDIPFWPQLPKRDTKENMYLMFSEHLPGVKFNDGRMYIDSSMTEEQETFYIKVLENPEIQFPVSKEYSNGLFEFIRTTVYQKRFHSVKGHVTGPFSFGLQINDEDGKPIVYNDILMDIIVKNISGIIRWQERLLEKISDRTVVFLDEPYLSLLGSACIAIEANKIISMINEIVSVAKGKIGVHCCGNTDWSLLLKSKIDIISFDSYNYDDNFIIYKREIFDFLMRGGSIAWGIVPTDSIHLTKETIDSLFEKFSRTIQRLSDSIQLSVNTILQSSIITPACGFGTRDDITTIKAFKLTKNLSTKIREHYRLGDNNSV